MTSRLEQMLAIDVIRYSLWVFAVQIVLVFWMASIKPENTGLPFALWALSFAVILFILFKFSV
jgi:hypothetical protein